MALAGACRGAAVLAAVLLAAAPLPAVAAEVDPQLAATAREARQTVTVIDWFYAAHHACPQPSKPEELALFRGELGDGFSVEPQGQFIEIRGIAMPSGGWLYYSSLQHPDRCTLWHRLGWDPALIWRRHREGARWLLDPGDGTPERVLKLTP